MSCDIVVTLTPDDDLPLWPAGAQTDPLMLRSSVLFANLAAHRNVSICGGIVSAQTPPGWYPDPSGSGRQMYWDGQGWATPQAPTATKSSSGRKWIVPIVTIVVLLFAIGKCGSGDNHSSSSTSSGSRQTSSRPSASPSAAPTPTAAPAGSPVRDGKFEFQVLGVTRAQQAGDLSNQFEVVDAQGEFIIVTMSVTNIGDRAQSYFGSNQKLIDTSGRQYEANNTADMWANKGTGDINPGNSIQVQAAFDVPPGTQPSALEVHDSMFSGGANVQL